MLYGSVSLFYNMRLFLGLLYFLLFQVDSLKAQIKTDSTLLIFAGGEKILKVVARSSIENTTSIAWLAENDSTLNLTLQLFSAHGQPLTDTIRLATVAKENKIDFDLICDTTGNLKVGWSEFDSSSLKYDIFLQRVNDHGGLIGSRIIAGSTINKYVKLSGDDNFLIAWLEGSQIKVMFYDQNLNITDPAITVSYTGTYNEHIFPLEYLEGGTFVQSWLKIENGISGMMRILNKQGQTLFGPSPDYTECCMEAFDMDFNKSKTMLSFSIANDDYLSSGTYIGLLSNKTTNQNTNFIKISEETSTITQLFQNGEGVTFFGRKSTSGRLSVNMIMPSGHPTDNLEIYGNTGSMDLSSFDLFTRENSGTVVYALNDENGAHLFMQRIRYNLPRETEEIIANTDYQDGGLYTKSLSSNHTNVVLWQHKENGQSKLLAQIFDRGLNKIGEEIDITGFRNHGLISNQSYFDFDAAIDSAGNFFVVWKEYEGLNISAKKFDSQGNILINQFNLNATESAQHSYPKIAANQKGDYVAVWRNGNGGTLRGRLIGADYDSGEKIITDCCQFQPDYTYLADHQISINDNEKIVYAYRNGYYNLNFLIIDKNFELIQNSPQNGMLDTNSEFNLCLSNSDQIAVAWTKGGFENAARVQLYNGLGSPVGASILLDNSVEILRPPSMAMNGSGQFSVIYKDRYPTSAYIIQKFTSSGTKDGPASRVNTFLSDLNLDISMNSMAEIFASWRSSAFNNWDVIVKGYLNDGAMNDPVFTYLNATIFEGDSLEFCDFYLKKPGIYSCDFQTLNGNDSIIVLTLKVEIDDPPAKPEGLTINFSISQLELAWEPNHEADLKEYYVYRNLSNDRGSADLLAKVSETNYVDNTLSIGNEYFYWVRAADMRNNISEFSDVVSFVITDVETDLRTNIKVFPNPATDQVTIKLPDGEIIHKVQIIGLLGYEFVVNETEQSNVYVVSTLKSGVYHLKITTSKHQYLAKIMKR